MAKNRKTKTFSSKYGQYTSPIELTEDGITYEVLLENIIAYMDRHFDKEPYKGKTRFEDKITAFLDELIDKFSKEGKDRYADRCNTYKTFNRYFEALTKEDKSKEDKSKEDRYRKKCLSLIKDMELFFNTQFLSDPHESLSKKNQYIDSLLRPLIGIMVNSNFFYYIPHTTEALGYKCYWNQVNMIEKNIEILFRDEDKDVYALWQEIMEPFRRIIGDGDSDDSYPGGDFPGITSSLWLEANPAIGYFDCVYDIAETDYELYEQIINGKYKNIHFNFEIGTNKEDVEKRVEQRRDFFRTKGVDDETKNDFEKEMQLFYIEFEKAYLNIVKQRLKIKS